MPDAPSCATSPIPTLEPGVAGLSVDALEYGAKWHDDPGGGIPPHRIVRLTVATAYLSGVFAALNAGLTTLQLLEPLIWVTGRACCLSRAR